MWYWNPETNSTLQYSQTKWGDESKIQTQERNRLNTLKDYCQEIRSGNDLITLLLLIHSLLDTSARSWFLIKIQEHSDHLHNDWILSHTRNKNAFGPKKWHIKYPDNLEWELKLLHYSKYMRTFTVSPLIANRQLTPFYTKAHTFSVLLHTTQYSSVRATTIS